MSQDSHDLDFGTTIRGFSSGRKVFNRYTLQRLLGRGGMGVVWLARDEELEREVALKFLPEVVALDKEAVRDLKRETRRSLELTHPQVVRIYDFILDTQTAAISMEYVAGDTLAAKKVEQAQGHFEVETLAPWVRQVCEALEYAHTKAGVVHRDLKPANVMLDGRGEVKITDFGIAASVGDSVSRVSAQASTSGTPHYMSPQQMMGEKPAATDDIYSLGATLYELLTGKPPFYSGNVLAQVQSKVPPSMTARRAELEVTGAEPIPEAWEETVAACLAKEAGARPQSAKEVWERLGSEKRKMVESGKAGNGEKAEKAEKVERVEVGNVERGTSNAERRREGAEEGRKSRTGMWVGLAAAVLVLGGAGYWFGVAEPERARKAEIARLEAEGKAAEAARLAAARGGVAVKTEPTGAEVSVGALERGRSPLTIREARLGKYPVKVRLEGYEEWSGEVEVKENVFAEVEAKLERSTGGVKIGSVPLGLSYELSSREKTERGTTPATLSKVPTGEYTLTVKREGWPEERQRVTVGRNAVAEAEVRFEGGTLELTSEPNGAEVWAGGRLVGKTPLKYEDVVPRAYAYEYRLKGYKVAKVEGRIEAGKVARASVELEKQNFPEAGQAWENTLGMKFVPVPGTGVLFGVWETRVKDFAAFAAETGHDATGGMYSNRGDGWKQQGDTWKSPGFPQAESHPVVGVNQADAKAFCAWLTKKERAAGRLGENQEYRLPTDGEWEAAVGKEEFPWGSAWPPPRGAGNYADEAAKRGRYKTWNIIAGYDDGYDATAPVGSFTANRYGIHDLGGNVWEYVGDRAHGLRGASFGLSARVNLASSYRGSPVGGRGDNGGFRVVVAVGSAR